MIKFINPKTLYVICCLLILNYESFSQCTGTFIPGTSTASPSGQVCSGSYVTLKVSGVSANPNLTFVWQSSTTIGGVYTDISTGSSSSLLNINPTLTLFYRAAISCGTTTLYSTPVEIPVSSGSSLPGGIYSINSGVTTGGNNFQSFGDAINAMSCGITGPVTFIVANNSGPYNEQIVIPQIVNASSINRITFKGNNNTLKSTDPISSNRAIVTINGADYVTIDSLIIDSSGTNFGWGLLLTNDANYNTISNCTINVSIVNTLINNGLIGIVMSASSSSPNTMGSTGNYNLIKGNKITGGIHGIAFTGNNISGEENFGNIIDSNYIYDTYQASIRIHTLKNTIVSRNDISRPNRQNTLTTAGVSIDEGAFGTLVEKNRIHNFFDQMPGSLLPFYGILCSSNGINGAENKIINNIIYGINHNGTAYGILNNGASYMQAYHNTIVFDHSSTGSSAQTIGILQTAHGTNIEIRNNIIYLTRGGTAIKRALSYNTPTSEIVSNNNVFYFAPNQGSDNFLGQFGTATFSNLANWKTANSNYYDQNSSDADPLFVSLATNDLKPTTSLIDNMGVNLGISTDIDGNQRSSTPDPGAYEFSTPLPVSLLYFTAYEKENGNLLYWETLQETNSLGFEIQRSANGADFDSIGFVKSISSNGNSSYVLKYEYQDRLPQPHNYYRVKQIDNNGQFAFSKIIEINNATGNLMIKKLYPNPCSSTINLHLYSKTKTPTTIIISDIMGKIKSQYPYNLLAGDNKLCLDIKNVPVGAYVLKVLYTNGETQSIRLLKK